MQMSLKITLIGNVTLTHGKVREAIAVQIQSLGETYAESSELPVDHQRSDDLVGLCNGMGMPSQVTTDELERMNKAVMSVMSAI